MKAPTRILSVSEMYDADRLAIKSGITGLELMEHAGCAIAAEIEKNWEPCEVLVLCGPGNNGGDGYVVARILTQAGWPVSIAAFGDPASLKGDAAVMYGQCPIEVSALENADIPEKGLLVDAVFGAGFKGELPAEIRNIFRKSSCSNLDIISVDVPSGIDGNTGAAAQDVPTAAMTVSFFRPKIGHLFYPARAHTGRLKIVDIGIPEDVLAQLPNALYQCTPELWLDAFPTLSPVGHKYDRGHAAIVGGGMASSGAARIAAKTTLRAGAGAVTVICPPSALMVYAAALEAVMVKSLPEEDAFALWMADRRIGAVLLGPGNGIGGRTRAFVRTALTSAAHVVLDADALTEFKDDPQVLFDLIASKTSGCVVLTPHEAEFARLFDFDGSALERCRLAAAKSGAIVLLKGATTVISTPSGDTALNISAPPWLATAGSGDALAGIVTALLLNCGDTFKAVAAAVWIHGETASNFGRGMIAEDIEKEIPKILHDLMERGPAI